MSFDPGIRVRMVWSFSLMIAVLIVFSGAWYYLATRRILDGALGERLATVALASALSVPADVVLSFGPSDQESRSYEMVSARLGQWRTAGGVDRIYIVDQAGRRRFDTRDAVQLGQEMNESTVFAHELAEAFAGGVGHSSVFKGENGRWYKSAYAPLTVDDRVRGAVMVEAGADFLAGLTILGHTIAATVMIGVVLTTLLGYLIAFRITSPLKRLTRAAARLGEGDMGTPVHGAGGGEVGELAAAFEEMRISIMRRDEQMKGLLAQIAHEIRNPLGGIQLFTDMLGQDIGEEPRARETLDRIINEVRELDGIITEYLLFARPIHLQPGMVEMGVLIRETLDLVADRVADQAIAVQVELLRDGRAADELRITADVRQLRQVLLNLFGNALDAMPEGGRLLIMARLEAGWFECRVADSGAGIAESVRERLFDPYCSTKESGWGLGLAVVRRVAEAHGGSVALVEMPGYRTAFAVRIPLE
ncbi:HAMP domain-containing histidine kinase [bacterium]|nr:HAMP domain-containing histidine kinase [candidate division CSSED10-310 bacterium]